MEAYTEFEGNEFVIDVLGRGSLINYRAFLLNDRTQVSFRCKTPAQILTLSHAKMMEIIKRYESLPFGRDMLLYQHKILKQGLTYPCDYTTFHPSLESGGVERGAVDRENRLKNVVMRIVMENRQKRNRPSLRDVIKVYMLGKKELQEQENEHKSSKDYAKNSYEELK